MTIQEENSDPIRETPARYWFKLPNEKGRGSTFHYPTYREAYEAANRQGGAAIWYTDETGDQEVDHVYGQEAFGIGWDQEHYAWPA